MRMKFQIQMRDLDNRVSGTGNVLTYLVQDNYIYFLLCYSSTLSSLLHNKLALICWVNVTKWLGFLNVVCYNIL